MNKLKADIQKGVSIPEYIRKLKKQQQQKAERMRCKQQGIKVDLQKMRQRKIQKQKTIEQKIKQVELNGAESDALLAVFQKFDPRGRKFFTCEDLSRVLRSLGVRPSRRQLQLMIWDIDEDLDQKVSFQEFRSMYIRCIMDETGLQSQDIFFLTQFLMYSLQKIGESNEEHHPTSISVEDTLQLLYVRAKQHSEKNPHLKIDENQMLQQEIEAIFTKDNADVRITFSQYRQKMIERMAQKRKLIEQNKLRPHLLKPGAVCD